MENRGNVKFVYWAGSSDKSMLKTKLSTNVWDNEGDWRVLLKIKITVMRMN